MNRFWSVAWLGVLSSLLVGCQSGGDGKAAFDEFVRKAPAAYCSWSKGCGKLTGTLEACTADLTQKMAEGLSCPAAQQAYEAIRAAADACLAGGTGPCGKDDFDVFCPAFAGVDLDHVCRAKSDSGVPQLGTAQRVVGGWKGSNSCPSATFEFGYIICPKGRLRGYEKIGSGSFVDCGTWTVSGDRLTAKYTSTSVADPTQKDSVSFDFIYKAASDTLTWDAKCPVVLQRLKGQTKEEDCTSSKCSAGGSGDITGCSIDCDCGHCWYCDKGTCRYGGEGPYGCYRGCGP